MVEQIIDTKQNKKVKYVNKLKLKKFRHLYQRYLVRNEKAIQLALEAGVVKTLFTLDLDYRNTDCEVVYVTKEIMHYLTDYGDKCRLLAVCEIINKPLTEQKLTLVLDDLQDPGNVGTIIRTARAFGINNVVVSEKTVDVYNQKVVDAMQGCNYEMNIVKINLNQYLSTSKNVLVTTYLNKESSIDQLNLSETTVNYDLLFGNETHGISAEYQQYQHYNYKLELSFESLNVSVAAGIIMYDLVKEFNV